MIETQRHLHPIPRKALMPGASGSSEDLHAEQIQASQLPTSRYLGTYSTLAPSEPPAKPRLSEGAISIEAKHGKSVDGRALPGHMSNLSQDGVLQNSTAIPHVTIIANSSIPEKGQIPRRKQEHVMLHAVHTFSLQEQLCIFCSCMLAQGSALKRPSHAIANGAKRDQLYLNRRLLQVRSRKAVLRHTT